MPEENAATDFDVSDAALEAVAGEAASRAKPSASPADKKIADLAAQLQEANERALRSHAELENFRKRAQRELADERRYAIVPLVRDLLPVVDNLERALAATLTQRASEGDTSTRSVSEGQPADASSLRSGVQMVLTQFESILKAHHCVRIETVGASFDPNVHEAIGQEPSAEYPAGTVTRAFQAGFKLEGRTIRPAQVFVSTGPAT